MRLAVANSIRSHRKKSRADSISRIDWTASVWHRSVCQQRTRFVLANAKFLFHTDKKTVWNYLYTHPSVDDVFSRNFSACGNDAKVFSTICLRKHVETRDSSDEVFFGFRSVACKARRGSSVFRVRLWYLVVFFFLNLISGTTTTTTSRVSLKYIIQIECRRDEDKGRKQHATRFLHVYRRTGCLTRFFTSRRRLPRRRRDDNRVRRRRPYGSFGFYRNVF